MRSKLSLAAVVTGSLLAAACGGPWTVVKQSSPNPFNAQVQFSVAPVTFNNLKVGKKLEGEWLASKKPEAQQSHQNDKALFSQRFQQMMVTKAKGLNIQPMMDGQPPAGFSIRPNIYWFEPGFYAVVAANATQIRMVVDVVDPAGQLVDQIEVAAAQHPQLAFTPIVFYTVTERLMKTAEEAANRVTRYLRERSGLPK
jgi:hypothetical protein